MQSAPILWVSRINFKDPSREADYLRWGIELHSPEFLRLPNVLSVVRYECIRGRKTNPNYMNIAEIESEEVLDSTVSSPEALAIGEDTRKTWGDAIEVVVGAYRPIFGLRKIAGE